MPSFEDLAFGREQNNDKKFRQAYRELFTSETGVLVLYDILVNFCHFGCYFAPEENEAYKVGVSILSRMGIYSPDADKLAIIRALCSVTPATIE